MNNKNFEKNLDHLTTHLDSYNMARKTSQKRESAIFDKYRQPDGTFAPEMHGELEKHRNAFAAQWGKNGQQNREFLEFLTGEIQRPSEDEVQDMHNTDMSSREEFVDNLNAKTAQKQGQQRKPKLG